MLFIGSQAPANRLRLQKARLKLVIGHQMFPKTSAGAYRMLVNSGGNWELRSWDGGGPKRANNGNVGVFILCLK